MSDRPGLISDEEIEAMAWQLEAAMAKIRQDPHAALTAGLDRIRATLIAEMQADLAKLSARTEAAMAKIEAEFAAKQRTKMEAAEAELRTKMEAAEVQLRTRWKLLRRRSSTLSLSVCGQVNAAAAEELDPACAIVAVR